MKIRLTLLVFHEGRKQGEFDLLAEYPDAIAAIRAVAQLGAANSLLFCHPDVAALFKSADPKSLARINESMGDGVVVQIKDVAEHREVMPEELRAHPNALHIIASRPVRNIPLEGLIQLIHDGQIH